MADVEKSAHSEWAAQSAGPLQGGLSWEVLSRADTVTEISELNTHNMLKIISEMAQVYSSHPVG